MSTIIATGGGSYSKGETEKIDLEMLRISKERTFNSKPKMLYFSTAGDNEPTGSREASDYFTSLGYDVEIMSLILDMPSDDEISARITEADTVYVGGGDLIRLVHTMRSLDVVNRLVKAAESGTVLAGISAGASCWFDFAHSDSLSYYGGGAGYIRFPCFGLIHAICSPHYGTQRKADLRNRIAEGEAYPVCALENGTALLWEDGVCRTLIQKPDRRVHIYLKSDNPGEKRKIIRPHENEEFSFESFE